MYYSEYFNYNYMEFVGYEKCDKLIWTSGKGCRKKIQPENKVLQKIYEQTSRSLTLRFCCYPHKDTCDILSEDLVSQLWQAYSSKLRGAH